MTQRAGSRSTPTSLDEAWGEVERALPAGWRLQLQQAENDLQRWEAAAVSPAFFDGATDDEIAFGFATTPAEALHKLAAKLKEPR